MSSEADLRYWKSKMAVGRMAYGAGMFRLAARHFMKAKELIEERNLPESTLSPTLVSLAKSLGSFGQFDEAEPLLQSALKIDESATASDPALIVELIEDYHQLSLLYWRAGKADMARAPLDRAFSLLKMHPDVPDELTAKLLKHRAVLAEISGDYELCEKSINEAIDFILESKDLGKHSLIYGDCLLVKVTLLTEFDKYDEAIELYREAMQILAMIRGDAHPKLLESLEGLAALASKKGLERAAANLHQRAEHVKADLRKKGF